MKNLIYSGLLSLALLCSCKPEVNPSVLKPTADSFSPGIAKTGDTVYVIGSALNNSKILLDDKEVPILLNTDNLLSFVVTDGLTKEKSIFKFQVRFSNGTSTTFSQSILLNHIVREIDLKWLGAFKGKKAVDDTLATGPSQLLLTDFDGHGVRTANKTDRFDQTQWTALVLTGGSQLITNNFLGVSNTPAGNNFLATQLNPEFVGTRTSGFVGEFINSTDFLNNRIDKWKENFSLIPGSPIVKPLLSSGGSSKTTLADTYLNFFLYKNNKSKGSIRPYLTNDNLVDSLAFAFNLPVSKGNDEWVLISIPFRSFKTAYGYGLPMDVNDYSGLNKLKFVFTHADKADENSSTSASDLVKAVGDVQIYIDHVIITQGGPYMNPPTQ